MTDIEWNLQNSILNIIVNDPLVIIEEGDLPKTGANITFKIKLEHSSMNKSNADLRMSLFHLWHWSKVLLTFYYDELFLPVHVAQSIFFPENSGDILYRFYITDVLKEMVPN